MLRSCLSRKACRQFREGQNLHNYYFDEWLEDNFTQPLTPVKCFVKDKQEPYLILKKSAILPRFAEEFVNYGYNKVQWIATLRYQGWRFYVLGTGFAIDVAHPRSEYQKEFLDILKTKHITLNQNLYSKYLSNLLKGRNQSVTKTCRRQQSEVDINASIDFYHVCLTNKILFIL